MPKKKVIGSELTKREIETYNKEEMDAPEIADKVYHDQCIPALIKDCENEAFEALKALGLPTQPGFIYSKNGQWVQCSLSQKDTLISELKSGRKQLNPRPNFLEDWFLMSASKWGGYTVHHGYWDFATKEDTPPWLAVKILSFAEMSRRQIELNDTKFACYYAFQLGRLKERLFWMMRHEAETKKGYKRIEFERKAQFSGAKGNAAKAAENRENAMREVRKLFTADQMPFLSNNALANRLIETGFALNNGLTPSDRTLREYMKKAREDGKLPQKLEK